MRGHSVLEVLLTVGLLTLLMMAVLLVYVTGTRAWLRGDAQAERLGQTQALTARLVRDLQVSLYAGLEVSPEGVSCLSPHDQEGKVEPDQSTGKLAGKRFILYWTNGSQIRRRELTPSLPKPIPLSLVEPVLPLATYFQAGETITRLPTKLRFSQDLRLVTCRLEGASATQELTVRVRN